MAGTQVEDLGTMLRFRNTCDLNDFLAAGPQSLQIQNGLGLGVCGLGSLYEVRAV